MTFSNSYIRAFAVCVVIVVAFMAVSFFQHGVNYGIAYWSSSRAGIIMSMLGVASAVTTGLVGTFSRRSEKPWSWLKIGVVCFGCWIATIFVMASLILTFIH